MPSDTDEPKTYRCRSATTSGERCSFHGTRDELRAHTADVGHPPCWSCRQGLASHELQTCGRCADRVRDDLTAVAIAYAHLERRIGEGAYYGGWLTALAMLYDGTLNGGGEDDHIRYKDPNAVVATLELHDRDWREQFDHGRPPYLPLGHPDRRPDAVLRVCLEYLRAWHSHAAREHPAFEDYAADIRQLRARVEHLVALANDPLEAPIPCACGGRLERHFAPQGGLADDWVCRTCRASYDGAAYLLRLRVLTEMPGWVSVDAAARATDRPVQSVWAWVRAGDVPVACSWFTRRMVVELVAVQVRSDAAPRVTRKSA